MAEGMLVVWTDVDPAGEDDFEEWYNREHVNERAAIKGFLSGHRYAAIRGRPRYLALYETRTPQVLSSKPYREVSEAPTGWTKRVTRQFQNTTRGVFQVRARQGEGRGGVVASLRMTPPAAGGPELARWLSGPALRAVVKRAGMVRAEFLEAVELTGPAGSGRGAARANAEDGLWAVLVDGADERVVAGALAEVLSPAALKQRGARGRMDRGLYRYRSGKTAGGR